MKGGGEEPQQGLNPGPCTPQSNILPTLNHPGRFQQNEKSNKKFAYIFQRIIAYYSLKFINIFQQNNI